LLVDDVGGPDYHVDDGEQQHRNRIKQIESDFAVGDVGVAAGCVLGYPITRSDLKLSRGMTWRTGTDKHEETRKSNGKV
jgi:hypothetical protein